MTRAYTPIEAMQALAEYDEATRDCSFRIVIKTVPHAGISGNPADVTKFIMCIKALRNACSYGLVAAKDLLEHVRTSGRELELNVKFNYFQAKKFVQEFNEAGGVAYAEPVW